MKIGVLSLSNSKKFNIFEVPKWFSFAKLLGENGTKKKLLDLNSNIIAYWPLII